MIFVLHIQIKRRENNMEEFIKKIYNEMINLILKDVPSNYISEVSNKYMEYLKKIYSDKYQDNIDYNSILNIILDLEQKTWQKAAGVYKLKIFVEDESLNKIKQLSNKAYKLAKDKKNNNSQSFITVNEIKQDLKILDELLLTVKEFNKEEAKHLVSETICDLVYASKNTMVTSLRIGHLKK